LASPNSLSGISFENDSGNSKPPRLSISGKEIPLSIEKLGFVPDLLISLAMNFPNWKKITSYALGFCKLTIRLRVG
jgi:hypothetical protein